MADSKQKLKINGDGGTSLFQIILRRKSIRQMFTFMNFALGLIWTYLGAQPDSWVDQIQCYTAPVHTLANL
jgi:hypothetical protein